MMRHCSTFSIPADRTVGPDENHARLYSSVGSLTNTSFGECSQFEPPVFQFSRSYQHTHFLEYRRINPGIASHPFQQTQGREACVFGASSPNNGVQ